MDGGEEQLVWILLSAKADRPRSGCREARMTSMGRRSLEAEAERDQVFSSPTLLEYEQFDPETAWGGPASLSLPSCQPSILSLEA